MIKNSLIILLIISLNLYKRNSLSNNRQLLNRIGKLIINLEINNSIRWTRLLITKCILDKYLSVIFLLNEISIEGGDRKGVETDKNLLGLL
jgi:hypothetical protein